MTRRIQLVPPSSVSQSIGFPPPQAPITIEFDSLGELAATMRHWGYTKEQIDDAQAQVNASDAG